MTTIKQMIIQNVSNGMTEWQAKNYVAQEIILGKISKSKFANKVLIKGGVVLFNETHELRRTTDDLDFDFIRYDISDKSIENFIDLLNNQLVDYKVILKSINPLNQDDYKGKRVIIIISDSSESLSFKLDIGVHTLLGIEQSLSCFSFESNQANLVLRINPPEQMVAEKLYSLAKHGALSTRLKDVFDIFYFIKNHKMNRTTIKQCIDSLTIKGRYNIKTIEDICERIDTTFSNRDFVAQLKTTKDKWIDDDVNTVLKTILDFIYSI